MYGKDSNLFICNPVNFILIVEAYMYRTVSVGLFNARILPKHTRINDQDRFLKPNKDN
jgi:hypothetical protein